MSTKPDRLYCGDRTMTYCKNCGAEITECDTQAGFCTQCHESLAAPELPLEQQLLQSIWEIGSQRREDAEREIA